MEFRAISGIFGAFSVLAAGAVGAATGVLEAPDSSESGISLIAGWHCTGKVIEIQVDDGPLIKAGSGTLRPDTAGICGRSDTGFGLTYNYNVHAAGIHSVTAYADGIQFAKRSFITYNFGTEYLQGANGTCVVDDFPIPGRGAILAWIESKQNFSIVSTNVADGTLFLRAGESVGSARTSVVETGCSLDLAMEARDFDEGAARALIGFDVGSRTMTVDLFTSGGRHCRVRGPFRGRNPSWSVTVDVAASDLSCLGGRDWVAATMSVDQHVSGFRSVGNETMVLIALRATAEPASGSCPRQWLSFHGASVPR